MYRALVTSIADPTNSGKIKVQCPQISGTAEIRAAEPANPADRLPNVGSTVWISFNGGDLTKPIYFSNSSFTEAHPNGSVSLTSLATATDPDPVRALALSGHDSQPTGSSTTPMLLITDGNGTGTGDIGVSGSVIKTGLFGASETWHTPTFGSGWASTGSFDGASGYHGMQYRFDAEDNVWIYGCAKTTTGATGTIFTLPPAYTPPLRGFITANLSPAGGNGTPMLVQVTDTGAVNYSAGASGQTPTANDEVFINGKFPLGNLS
jgi:hypothetical protein